MTKNDLVEISTSKSLMTLRPVIAEWTKIVLNYSKQFEDDACWWYTERATLSTLAGAAWRKNWCALEEYSVTKGAVSKADDAAVHRLKSGRCDLFLAQRKTSFAIEAKQAWQPIGDRVQVPNANVKKKLKAAWADVGELYRGEADVRIATTFVVPSFPKNVLRGNPQEKEIKAKQLVETWLPSIRRDFAWDAYAHVFPAASRLLSPGGGKRIFPGVVMLMTIRKKRMRLNISE